MLGFYDFLLEREAFVPTFAGISTLVLILFSPWKSGNAR